MSKAEQIEKELTNAIDRAFCDTSISKAKTLHIMEIALDQVQANVEWLCEELCSPALGPANDRSGGND